MTTKITIDRASLTIIANHGPAGIGFKVRSAKGDALVEQGYATFEIDPKGLYRYRATPAGEARLLNRSDVSQDEERAIARRSMDLHERE